MRYTIRQLELDDMDVAAGVHRIAFDQALPWLTGLHTPEEDRAFFRDHLFSKCTLWGAWTDTLAGFIAFRPGWIDQLYVLPDFQAAGIGSALLEKAQESFDLLQLWTFQRNDAARRFYEKRGFVAVDVTDGRENEEKEPDVLYRWQR
ncbi:GNAT family N-acetyltransferase [Brucella sp. IR073]|uniref:GNAT family N-acetyltransferase n=1 Tax=unclassified Brucella TaxID=2632610 RepID=UPI003B9870E8